MERQVRERLPEHVEKTPVLYQDGVHTQAGGRPGSLDGAGQLPVRQQGVQGQKHPHAPLVAIAQGIGKFLVGEIFGAAAGVELAPAQIDGAGTILYGCPEGFRGAGGGEEFDVHQRLRLALSRRCCRRKISRFSSLTSLWAWLASSR